MKPVKGIKFNQHRIDGWKCSCGETYFDPEQAQRLLLLNKLRKESVKVRLGRIRSNLILRLPKSLENALGLKKGEEVNLKVKGNNIVVEV
ncbi:MAG: AbrB/MazE/SpoVT family DNA-binding domain-containing protein [Candidatus Woesearchaeota archaeon]